MELWQYALIGLFGVFAIYELFTGNIYRWAERGSTKNVAEYCTLVTRDRLKCYAAEGSPQHPDILDNSWRSLTEKQLRAELNVYSRDVTRSIFNISPKRAFRHDTDGRLVIIYKYHNILCTPNLK